jgi:hypothetical protein
VRHCNPSLLAVVQHLYDHPEGLDPALTTGNICDDIKSCEKFTSVVAKKGDVFLLHGLLPHVASFNYLHYARVITNPHVTLKEPYNLNRAEGDYVSLGDLFQSHMAQLKLVQSLLEQVILRGLDRKSVPEYKPTRDRMYWYPRNWTFKERKIREELDAMIAVAKEKGLDESAVDSIWLQGEQAKKDFDRRNGMLLPVHKEAGLELRQHEL